MHTRDWLWLGQMPPRGLPRTPRRAAGDSGPSVTRSLLFDVGASTFEADHHNTHSGASLQWLVSTYQRLGVDFDQVVAWEATPHTQAEIFRGVPASLKERLTYHNTPVSAAHDSPSYPWASIARVASEADFVVVKLDIDNAPVELALIDDLANRRVRVPRDGGVLKPLHRLIDVFFYESHNRAPTMRAYWGDSGRGHGLNDSFALFTRLRQLGIMAHSWI